MDIQQRLIEASYDLRTRAGALGTAALDVVRSRAGLNAQRVDALKNSLLALSVAGRALNKVARRHAARFLKENSAIAVSAGKDVGALARSTYASLSGRRAATKSRKPRATRKRASSKAA